MTLYQWIAGVGGGLLVAAFLIFAFRQGAKVRSRQDGDGEAVDTSPVAATVAATNSLFSRRI
jgi:hypothetical protein